MYIRSTWIVIHITIHSINYDLFIIFLYNLLYTTKRKVFLFVMLSDRKIRKVLDDPFNILPWQEKKYDKKQAEKATYQKLKNQYYELYSELKKKDFPLDLLDIPKPVGDISIMGGGGGGSGGGPIIPILGGSSGLGTNYRRMIEEVRSNLGILRNARSQSRYGTFDPSHRDDGKHDDTRPGGGILDDPANYERKDDQSSSSSSSSQNADSVGHFERKDDPANYERKYEQKETGSTETGSTETGTDDIEYEKILTTKGKGVRKARKQAEDRGEPIVKSQRLREVLRLLTAKMRYKFFLKNIKKSKDRQRILDMFLNDNLPFQNELLRAFNRRGIYFRNILSPQAIARSISENENFNMVELLNELTGIFANEAPRIVKYQSEYGEESKREMFNTVNINTDSNHENIRNLLIDAGIEADTAEKFASNLLLKFSNTTDTLIRQHGDEALGNADAEAALGEYMADIADQFKGYKKFDMHIFKKTLIDILFHSKRAFGATSKMRSGEVSGLFNSLRRQIFTNFPVQYGAGRPANSPAENLINEEKVSDAVGTVRTEPGTGNVIMEGGNPLAAYNISASWQPIADIIRNGNFSISYDPNRDPDRDPDDPRGANVIIQYGRRRRRVNIKQLVYAMAIIGASSATIKKVVDKIKGLKPGETKNVELKPKEPKEPTGTDAPGPGAPTEDYDVKESDYTIRLPSNPDEMGKFDSYTPGAKIELTPQLKKAGLAKEIENYNKLADQYKIARGSLLTPDAGSHMEFELSQAWDELYKKMYVIQRPNKTDKYYLGDLAPYYEETFDKDTLPTFENVERLEKQHQLAQKEFMEAQRKNADPRTLQRLKSKVQITGKRLEDLGEMTVGTNRPVSYTGSDFSKFPLPKTPEEASMFNRIQRFEKVLTTERTKADPKGRGIADYNRFVQRDTSEGMRKRMGMSKSEFRNYLMSHPKPPTFGKPPTYEERLDKLRDIFKQYGYNDEYPERDLIKERGFGTEVDDADTDVYGDTETGLKREEQDTSAENFERPSQPIGGEALALASTNQERIEEQKRWDKYSFVKRGFGNGAKNPLYLETLRHENMRFGPLNPVSIQRSRAAPRPAGRKVRFVPVYQEDDGFDDAYDNTVFPTFMDERSTYTNEFRNELLVNPEHHIRKARPKATRIPAPRNDGQRFADYSYRYGDQHAEKPGHFGGVVSDHVSYDNQWGFNSSKNKLDEYYYSSAKKSMY
jgi:hypothetical protein